NFVYILIFLVPFNALRYCAFRDKHRIPVKVLFTLLTIIFSAQALIFCYIARQPYWNTSVTQRYQLIFSVFNLLLSFVLIKEKLSKQMFIFGFLFSVASSIMVNANYAEKLLLLQFPIQTTYFFTNIVTILQIAIIFPFLLKLMNSIILPALNISSGKSWNMVWFIFIFFYSGTFLSTYSFAFERSSNLSSYIVRIFCFGSIIVCSIIFAVALKQTAENVALMEKSTMIQRQLTMEQAHYHTLSRHIEETKTARHDLRHHLALIQSYVDSGNIVELKKYVTQYIKSVSDDTVITLCKNYAVNTIVHYYLEQAKSENIETDIRINLPESIAVTDCDLCIVFGNLLENALEACNRQQAFNPFITVSAALAGDYVVIAVDNSYGGKIKKENGVFLSSKREGKGIGITSVQAVAENYNGQADFDFCEGVFRASVMLKLVE
ncbi:MAG: GHKL domain-containing protein, partial [Lachnospiraceae bacterium]|nr:GHKL domain-containing protein [Lachnospiraceae bacterium]